MKKARTPFNRREFLGRSARGVGWLALNSAVVASSTRADGAEKNPFAYDVTRFAQTDPKLVRYAETTRFKIPNPEPHRIALGPADRLYVAARNGIDVLDHSGGHLGSIPLDVPARCVTVSPDGTVYAGLKDHIEVFDNKGGRVGSWETPGKKTWLTGLAVGANELFAADSGNRLVWRYDRTGRVLGRIGEKNKERNVPGLIVPSPYLDVAVGQDNLLRVNNPGRHCVEIYTRSGDLELSWGKPSANIEGFCGCCNPIGLTVFPDGSCITCEKGLPRVKVYSVERNFDCVVAGPEAFTENAKAHDMSDCTVGGLDAAVDLQGQIYVLDLITAGVRVMKKKA